MSGPSIDELLAAAQLAWPGIDADPAEFARRVQELADQDADLRHASDLYLACACAAGNAPALRHFEHSILPAVDVAVRKLDSSPSFIDEVRQVLRNKLLVPGTPGEPARIASYAGRGPLATWVRVAAVRSGLTLMEKRRRELPASQSQISALAPVGIDPGLQYLKRRYAGEFEAAFRQACESLPARAQTLLRLNFGDGMNIEQIGAIYGVHRATVARWIAKARTDLLEQTRAALAERLKLTTSEFESMVELVRSQLDISISQFFAATND